MVLSPVERLDLLGRAKADTEIVLRARIVLSLVTPFLILLALYSEAPRRETVLVYVLAGASFVVTIALWIDWRFKLYALAIFCLLFACADALSKDHSHSHDVLGWLSAYALVPLLIYYGCALWIVAKRYALANGESFRKERRQLDIWMDRLTSATAIEFPSGSFWTGYWTYRLFNSGSCWIVAQFKRGSSKLRSCRVYESGDVSFKRLPSGRWQINLVSKSKQEKSFVEVEISPESASVLSTM